VLFVFDRRNVTASVSAVHDAFDWVWCFRNFTMMTCLRSHELRSSALHDIFNDSYDLMEEKTGRSLCRLAMAIPVPQLDTFTSFHIIMTATAPSSSCIILFVPYSSEHVAAKKRREEFGPCMNDMYGCACFVPFSAP
jgi:hypothetical protein